jgi:hypothetical protein
MKEVCAMEVPIYFVIRSAGAADPDTLRTYAERRLAFALRRFENRVGHVMVRLGDVNGPKRGVDSQCSVKLRLRNGGPPIDVDAVTPWPFASITLAAKRLNAAVRHELERAQVRVRGRRRSRFDVETARMR